MDSLTLLSANVLQAPPRLLGWQLTSTAADGTTGGVITEVEAYHGERDAASHAHRGPSTRNQPMFEAAGVVYVYRSYGIHLCLNLVTGPAGSAQAILIRSLRPTIGLPLMQRRRHQTSTSMLASGPGRVRQALGLSLEMTGTKLGDIIRLDPPPRPINPAEIMTSPSSV
ncbi:DNA-3-methyladenine glycosylase [Candidatus Saccharibacteria bacterium]|nr:DNA-3-methyladenine glycosylase [Candidatus Saccharibacteria bacterium]